MHAGDCPKYCVARRKAQIIQSLDLTELDWSPELWISCYDGDNQNTRIAKHIWEDNGLDVPETFFDVLRPFLG